MLRDPSWIPPQRASYIHTLWLTISLSHPKNTQPQKLAASPKAMVLCSFPCCYHLGLWNLTVSWIPKLILLKREKIKVLANHLDDCLMQKKEKKKKPTRKTGGRCVGPGGGHHATVQWTSLTS